MVIGKNIPMHVCRSDWKVSPPIARFFFVLGKIMNLFPPSFCSVIVVYFQYNTRVRCCRYTCVRRKINVETSSIVLSEQRAVIEFLNAKYCKSTDVHVRSLTVDGVNSMDIGNVRRRVLRAISLDKVKTIVYDVSRSVRPMPVTDEHYWVRVVEIIRNNRRFEQHEITTQV